MKQAVSCLHGNEAIEYAFLLSRERIKKIRIMESTRQQKINRLLQKELAGIFQQESRTMFMGVMISVTVVRVTPDLSLARVHVSIFPGDNKKEILKEIRIANPRIRGILGRRVGKQIRIIPELEFYIDDSLDYIENIDRLLKS